MEREPLRIAMGIFLIGALMLPVSLVFAIASWITALLGVYVAKVSSEDTDCI